METFMHYATPAIGTAVGLIFLALVGWGIAAFQKWTGFQFSEQQRKILQDAAEQIANAIKLGIASGNIQLTDLDKDNIKLQNLVHDHINMEVVNAMDAKKETVPDLLHRALARIGGDDKVLVQLRAIRRTPHGPP